MLTKLTKCTWGALVAAIAAGVVAVLLVVVAVDATVDVAVTVVTGVVGGTIDDGRRNSVKSAQVGSSGFTRLKTTR